jgi:hypothetical protein
MSTGHLRRGRETAGRGGAKEEGWASGADKADAGSTPDANIEATARHEAEGESYRRRGRQAITGETAPLKEMAQEAPDGHAGEE